MISKISNRFLKNSVFKKFSKAQEGATIIEYAIVAPVLFLMVMGIVEFSLIMYAQSVLDNSTTIASRFGTTGSNYSDEWVNASNETDRTTFIRSTINRQASVLLNPNNVEVREEVFSGLGSATGSGSGSDNPTFGSGGDAVFYHVSYRWPIFTPIIAEFFTSQSCGGGTQSGEDGVYNICSSILVTNERF